jgi:hypothetical protein
MTTADTTGSPNPVLNRRVGGPFTPAEAAEILGAPLDWIRRNAPTLPHRRYGRRIVFEVDDLDEIRTMCRRRPAEATTGPLQPVRGRR